jgi:hypothetical protein
MIAGAALGALIVIAAQQDTRRVMIVGAGRMANQMRGMWLSGTRRAANAAHDAIDQVAETVTETVR